MKYAYYRIHQHNLVANEKLPPNQKQFITNTIATIQDEQNFRDAYERWEKSNLTVSYANDEERDKIIQIVTAAYLATGNIIYLEKDLDSGIVYTGDRIWIEHVCCRDGLRIDYGCKMDCDKIKRIAYLEEVRENINMAKFDLAHPNNKKEKMKAELLPCPFCGSSAELSGCFPNGQYYIACTGCRVSLWYDRKDKAIGAWNTRKG